ncbi:flagellar motor switch protein FliN [Denitrificimonas caeni]|uniref:flagellar motor switch protein FliN n=1 Tax=Denitrificimonas caeni TaxID=521720 RepID=UPI0003B3D1ED|nr:flagellar motor switch protein FliN [Denitrificimonas caeni]MBO6227735.1 flagellar motor switch protein FliN [Shewanella sp.]
MNDENEQTSSEDQALADEWAAALAEADTATDQDDIDAMLNQSSGPAKAPMQDFPDQHSENEVITSLGGPNLDVILDIPVSISMEVGSTDISIRNLLQLNQGSVVELDRLAGEPLDVLVNGTLIAHGEVVVVNEKFGIRLTDVISPSERIKKLR